MGESVGTRQLNFQIPARVGNIGVYAVTATAQQVTFPAAALRRYITIFNDSSTDNLYYSVGLAGTTPTPVAATTGAIGTAGCAAAIGPNQPARVELQPGVDAVIGLVAAATKTTTARIWYSSNQEGYALGNPPGQA